MRRVRRFALGRPRLAVVLTGLTIAGLGWLLAGPVAAAIGGLYAMVAVRGWQLREARRAVERACAAMLVAVDAAASDLRAGLVPDPAPIGRAGAAPRTTVTRAGVSAGAAVPGVDRARPGVASGADAAAEAAVSGAEAAVDVAVSGALARLEAAYRISEALGTPLADLLDRVEADLRAAERLRLNVRAQTAGAQATSVLLAGLPVVGLVLGVTMGFDPFHQLLRTPVGGACAIAAALLQCGGLVWTTRLVRGATAGVR
jgi:tight adherence protein B